MILILGVLPQNYSDDITVPHRQHCVTWPRRAFASLDDLLSANKDWAILMRQVYSVIALGYGGCLLVATFVWRAIPFDFVKSETAGAIAFAISAAMSVPFVTTYTRLGLNCAEGEKPSPKTKARHQH